MRMSLKMWTQIARGLVVLALLGSTAELAFAQRTSATLGGIVADPGGGALPGATAEIVNEGTGAVTSQVTDQRGEFLFNFVPVGSYTLKIALAGFRSYVASNIAIGAAQNVRRTYVLEIGELQEAVTVTGGIPLVNTISSEQRRQLDVAEIQSLPMANRNISGILDIAPGVTKQDASEGSLAVRLRLSGLGGSSLRVAADGTDASGNAGSPSLSSYQAFAKIDVMGAEAVGEAQIVKGVFPAEYGLAMAGFLNIITKSGANRFHGSAVYRLDDSSLTAKDPFLGTAPESTWHSFGGSLGGPLKRNRAFFFTAYEGYRLETFTSHNVQVPTQLLRDQMLAALPFPETRLFLDIFPLPTEPSAAGASTGVFRGPGMKIGDDDHSNTRLSVLLGGGNLSTVMTFGHPALSSPLAAQSPHNPRIYTSTTRRIAATYSIGRGSWTAETRFGSNLNKMFRIDQFNFVKDPDTPETIPGGRTVATISFPGLPTVRSEIQSRGAVPTLSFEQVLAVVKGQHALKLGGILFRPAGSKPGAQSPVINYPSVADLLANFPSQINVTFPANDYRWHATNYGFFLQDDWRITPTLVLNLGLRYDYYGRYIAKPVDPANPSGLYNLDGQPDRNFNFGPLRDPLNAMEPNPVNWGPRFGFAYNPDREGVTVLRGGVGLMTQPIDQQIFENISGNSTTIPRSTSYTRLEAQALGLKFPLYAEDVVRLIEAQPVKRMLVGGMSDPEMKAPSALAMTVNIQRAFGPSTVLETGYVGTRGRDFAMARTYNQVNRDTGLRPNPNLSEGPYWSSSQRTIYHSWQSSLSRRFTDNFMSTLNYTWGRTMAHTGGDISPGFIGDTTANVQDFWDFEAEWGPATGDIAHSFVGNWIYRTVAPERLGSGLLKKLVEGWEVAGIFRTRSGVPFDVTQPSALEGSRPDLLDANKAINSDCCSASSLQYLNRDAFALVPINPTSGTTVRRGNIGHNALRGPGYMALDLSLGRNLALPFMRPDANVQLRVDILNALDRPNYSGIRTTINSADFGKVISVGTPRKIQLQARLSF